MMRVRGVEQILQAYATVEGAGVKLHRAFGNYEVPQFDPFLMLDDFRAGRPEDYLAGFPWHPHRGIETVTYMLEGTVEHDDSMGNSGNVDAGDVQWMTAGSGIIHQEMPQPVKGRMGGFQLWVNLPAAHKMMDPRYQEIKKAQIPVVSPRPEGHHQRHLRFVPRCDGAGPGYYRRSPVSRCIPGSRHALHPAGQEGIYGLRLHHQGRRDVRFGRRAPGGQPGPGPVWWRDFDLGEVFWQGNAFPLCLRETYRGTCCLAGPDCDEYPGRTAPGFQGI